MAYYQPASYQTRAAKQNTLAGRPATALILADDGDDETTRRGGSGGGERKCMFFGGVFHFSVEQIKENDDVDKTTWRTKPFVLY